MLLRVLCCAAIARIVWVGTLHRPTSVHLRKFNLLMLYWLKRGFLSYVNASRQEGSILNGDARDYDVST
jgi:hypothetical protein